MAIIKNADRLYFVGCGTAFHACLFAKRGLSVRCPPRMPDRRMDDFGGKFFFEIGDSSKCFCNLQNFARRRDPRAVIAPVFERFKPLEHYVYCISIPCIANNSAHKTPTQYMSAGLFCVQKIPAARQGFDKNLFVHSSRSVGEKGSCSASCVSCPAESSILSR